MPIELEAAVADTLNSAPEGGHAPAPHAVCANCDAVLRGPFCHVCGQSADHHKRSVFHLICEVIEGLFHLDGRLLRTVPDLFFRPGRLAKDYMAGRLARHVPPFRTFLVALLLYIFAAEHAMHEATAANERERERHLAQLATPQGRAALAADARQEATKDLNEALAEARKDRDGDLKDADEDRAKIQARYDRDVARAQAEYAKAMDKAVRLSRGEDPQAGLHFDIKVGDDGGAEKARSLKAGVRKAVANPEYFLAVLFEWGHRLAVLLLPIVGLSLALVYRNRPHIFIHDHLLVAMNLLSFAFLTNAVGLILPGKAMGWWLTAAALWLPINMFQTLRGGYGSSVVGALAKTLVIWAITVTSFVALLVTLMIWVLGQL